MATTLAERRWSADLWAGIFGGAFIIVGVLGFVPNPLVSDRGLFEVNTLHNLIHIVSGGVLLASPFYNAPVATLRVVGVLYALTTLLGFVSLDSLHSMGVAANPLDNWLHLVVSAALLWAGFALVEEDRDRITPAHR